MKQHPQGQLLLLVLIVIGVSIIFSSAMLTSVVTTHRVTSFYALDQLSLTIAEAGVERAVWCLNHPDVCGAAYGGETRTLTQGEYVSSITTISSTQRQLDVVAYVPSQQNPVRTRHIRTTIGIDATTISFNYGVQVNTGGLELQNNARVVGNVYSNGSITGGNGAEITEDVYIATGMALDDAWSVANANQIFGQKSGSCSSSITDVAQSFTAQSSGPLSLVRLYIKKFGNPANITMHIVADNSGEPGTTPLSSGIIDANLVTTSYGWVTVAFPSPTTITDGEDYWIVLDAECETSKYWFWSKDQNQGFGNGYAMTVADWQSASPNWLSTSGDMNFEVYTGGLPTYIDNVDVGGEVHANTIKNLTVYDDAFYQNKFNATIISNEYPGSDDPPVQAFPVSDGNIEEWKADALAGGILAGNQTISANQNLGPVKIEGDLILTNGAQITMQGPIWVEGNITLDISSAIRLDESFGSGSSVVIADYPSDTDTKGKILIQNNSNVYGTSTEGSYIMLLSTHSSETTIAVDITNNTEGAIFYAHNGTIKLSNNVNVKEVTGHKIILSENATITYESGLANSSFSSGPGASWAIESKSWRNL